MSQSNNFKNMESNYKDQYKIKKPRFKRLSKYLRKTAMDRANENPKKFLEEMHEPSIKGVKGVAF